MIMQKVTILLALLIGLLIVAVPIWIFWEVAAEPGASPPTDLLTLNTTNTTRIASRTSDALSMQLLSMLFPEGSPATDTASYVIVARGNWRTSVVASPLLHWLDAPLVLDPGGKKGNDAAAILTGPLRQGRLLTVAWSSVPAQRDDRIADTSYNALAARVDQFIGELGRGLDGKRVVMIVPQIPLYAVPAAYLAAHSGALVLFHTTPLSTPAQELLARWRGRADILLIGPGDFTATIGELQQYGRIHTINAGGERLAVALAQFYDEELAFGWGLDDSRYFSNRNFVLANAYYPELALAGLSLARFGTSGPLIWVDRDGIPPVTAQYLWKMKPSYFVTPAEGPFNHAWILGDPEIIGTRVQGQVHLSQEIGAYRFMEDGLSGMEMLCVLWIVFGFVSAAWILLHGARRISSMSGVMRATWTLLALVLGPIAIWLYRRSYHATRWTKHEGMTMWHRDGAARTLFASAMNRGFDGPLMLVLSWIGTVAGLPLIVGRNSAFWLGNPMMFSIYIAYGGALLLHWFVMHAGMFMKHESIPYGRAVRKAFAPAFLSMTAMAVGMMGFMWWIQMVELMMEGMPESDDIMWWGTTVISVVIGWLVALPVDHWLVKRKMQMTTM